MRAGLLQLRQRLGICPRHCGSVFLAIVCSMSSTLRVTSRREKFNARFDQGGSVGKELPITQIGRRAILNKPTPLQHNEGENQAGDRTRTSGVGAPTIDSVHFNINQGNSYRMELSKTMLAVATGLLAFTFSFQPTLTKVSVSEAMQAGWICLAASIIGGLVNMYGWEKFYLTYRDDFHGDGEKGRKRRSSITRWRRVGRFVQFAGLFGGVAGIGLFAYYNLQNIKLAH